MKVSRIVLTLVLVLVCAGLVFASGQEKKPAEKPAAKPATAKAAVSKPPMDEKAAMEMMEKLGTPSEGHQKLEALIGVWHAKNTMWMAPGKPPMISEGTSEHKWVLGGRFVEQRFEGTFMNMPFSGIGYTGYDNYKKQYVGVWMDTAGTSIMNSSGSFDPGGKVLSTTSKMDDFTTGKVSTIRAKLTLVSKDELLMEMYGPSPEGKQYRIMEIKYTRAGQ